MEAARRDSTPSDSTQSQLASSQRRDLTASPSQYLTVVPPESNEDPSSADPRSPASAGKGISPQSTASSSRQRVLDDGLAILLKSPHWKGKISMPGIMIPTDTKKQPQGTSAESAAQIVASMKAEYKRAAAIEAAARKLKASNQVILVRPPSPPVGMTQPFEDDLNLWKGKRLVSPSPRNLSLFVF